MNTIKLSYIVTTFNKFPYLQEVINHLVSNKKTDEEIIVTDGKSTDKSGEWLKEQYDTGKIDVFISEKDLGEAHGFNKGMMLARGELIKIITSDDIFYYPAINECREFMLNHPEIDIVTSVIPTADLRLKAKILRDSETISNFEKWKTKKKSYFFFNGIPLMIRRSQLPKLGLLHTRFTMVDYEYSMRVSKVANIALFTNPMALRVLNNTSNLITMNDNKKTDEYLKTDFMYDRVRLKLVNNYSFAELIGAMVLKIRYMIALRTRIKALFGKNNQGKDNYFLFDLPSSIPDAFSDLHEWLEQENKKQEGKFILSQTF